MNDYANITQITLLVRRLDIGTKVIRVRQHSQENQLFKYRKYLSYPPKEKVKLARANMDGQPMFYGAVFSNFCINDNPRLTCLLETNKEVLDDTFVGKKDLTYSLWLNKREINLFVIPVFDSYPHPAKDFEWYYELWKELMQDDRINKEQINVLKELSRHFSLTGEKKEEEKKAEAPASNGKLILAVTGCPTGIAHTYMAAEALEKKAKELGYRIKVETRGSGGAKNVLTKAEIAEAECIIVAADTQVPMDRFAGKPVIQCKVADGISKAEELLTKAANGHASIYEAGGKAADDEEEGKDSLGHQIYKHLMNGVSHMLPFVVGGGILIAIAFLIDGLSVDLNSLPLDQRSNFGTITPMAAMFKSIGGVAFGFMLPILAGFIAMSIADRPGLAVGFVGGAIAANGTSGFLGALAAGFLAGYIVLLLKKICSKLPDSLEGTKPVLIYPLFGIFMIGVLMTYVVEPPIGALNTLINNGLNGLNGASAVLLGALLGGMMSVDMGGPVNKAAYVFGTASIAAGNYNIMAAVMVGGMVPPIAIALATLIFKNKFTADERKAGPTNFIMGLSFITEGAIPFAASDPLHVLPACVVGSAAAGALSMAFNCTLMAPHGGIFVFLTVGNPLLYLVALAVGSAVGCALLGVLKKKTA